MTMKRPHLSIIGLMGIVALMALVASRARHGLGVFAEEMTSAVSGILLAFPFIGLFLRRFRPFCIGFALLAWGYMLVLLSFLGGYLPTTQAFDSWFPQQSMDWHLPGYDDQLEMERTATRHSLIAASHALTSLALGLAGGLAFHLLARRKIDDDPIADPLEGRLLNPDHAGRITDDAPDGRQTG